MYVFAVEIAHAAREKRRKVFVVHNLFVTNDFSGCIIELYIFCGLRWKMNVPNLLSLIRLLLVPVFVTVFFSANPNSGYIAAAIFLVAFLTDVADGYIARKYNLITKLGRILDPLADKLMKAAAVVCLTIRGDIPLWIILVLLAKELIMLSGGAVLLKKMRDVPSSNWFGKCAEGYICALTFLLIMLHIPPQVSLVLWCVALLIELLALAVYTVRAVKLLREHKEGKK